MARNFPIVITKQLAQKQRTGNWKKILALIV
jgi:hypothetical protein